MRFNNKKGFALITLILAIVIMTVLGAGIYTGNQRLQCISALQVRNALCRLQ